MKVPFVPSAPLNVLQVRPARRRFDLFVGSDQTMRAVRLSLNNDAWADPDVKNGSPYPQVNLTPDQARELADRLSTMADMIESGDLIVLLENGPCGLMGEVAVGHDVL